MNIIASPRTGRFVSTLILMASCSSCALPRTMGDLAIGKRMEDGEERHFSSPRELLAAGLVDDALGLASSNRYFDAENRLRKARYLFPGTDAIEFNLALTLTQTDQLDEAREILEQLLLKDPNNPDIAMALANVDHLLDDSTAALRLLKEAFKKLRGLNNTTRAALVARSTSNIDFMIGNEQEALCYSYEGLTLSLNSDQLGAHGLVLVGLNLFTQAKNLIETIATTNHSVTNAPLVKHTLALARYGVGDFEGALSAESDAIDLLPKMPTLGAEVNAAWWLMKAKVAPSEDETDKEKEAYEDQRDEVLIFKETSLSSTLMWPMSLRKALDDVQEVQE